MFRRGRYKGSGAATPHPHWSPFFFFLFFISNYLLSDAQASKRVYYVILVLLWEIGKLHTFEMKLQFVCRPGRGRRREVSQLSFQYNRSENWRSRSKVASLYTLHIVDSQLIFASTDSLSLVKTGMEQGIFFLDRRALFLWWYF